MERRVRAVELQQNPCGVEANGRTPSTSDRRGGYSRTLVGLKLPQPASARCERAGYSRTLVGLKLVLRFSSERPRLSLQQNPCGVEAPSQAGFTTAFLCVTAEPLWG